MDITYQYAKLRCDYGRQPIFCEMGPQICDNIAVDPSMQKSYVLRNPVHTAVQEGPVFSEQHINTIRAEYVTSGANHAEGGWPKDVNINDPEATQRYRRKVEKDDPYIHCIMSTAKGMEKLVLQNNALDMYDIYFTKMAPYRDVETTSCRTVNVYRDGTGLSGPCSRPVSSICWRPDGGPKFAVTYVDVDFKRNPCQPVNCSIWDVENANCPERNIEPPCPLLDLQYNQRQMNILAGGLMNGQVAIWDLRVNYPKPSSSCPPHVAHRDLVRSVRFINAKNNSEFFSSGPDGICKWWDTRNMSEPIDMMIVDVVPNNNVTPSMALARGASCLNFEPTMPTRYMVGTENGLVITGNRKGKSDVEKFPATYEAHYGPVWTVERNPAFLKNFLTVGDWMARIWSEDCRESSLIMTKRLRHQVTFGTWSPTRLSLMVLTHANGKVSLWDLLRNQNEPILNVQVSEDPLLRVTFHEKGSLLTCGSTKGNIYLLELSPSLVESDKSDKTLMTLLLEREAKRERILEARMREIRLKLRADAEGEGHTTAVAEPEVDLTGVQEATAEYFQITKKELALM